MTHSFPTRRSSDLIVESECSLDRVHHDVLEHGAETLRGRENLRFGILGKPDHLGVATALEIEHRGVGPAMFVITDQRAAGVGGQRRSEEHTSELQSQMRNSYAVVCLKKKKPHRTRESQ